jgi:DegV family protein with EDD domain
MPIKIVTDSTSDLPQAVAAEYGITVIPAYINIGDKSYLDGVELSRQEFYERLPAYDPPPTTSAPGLGTFVEAYERLAAGGATEVLSIHISSTLSGMLNVAHAAAQTLKKVRVTVFDSRQLTLGTGFLALAAAKAAAVGHSMAEIVTSLKEMALRVYSFAAVDTLEFLRRGGRLTRLQSSLGALLSIKPLLTMYDGEMTMERIRTRSRAIERLIGLVSELGPLEELALLHAHAPARAEEFRHHIQHLIPQGLVPFSVEVTPVIGAHVGPGAVGLVCVKVRAFSERSNT